MAIVVSCHPYFLVGRQKTRKMLGRALRQTKIMKAGLPWHHTASEPINDTSDVVLLDDGRWCATAQKLFVRWRNLDRC